MKQMHIGAVDLNLLKTFIVIWELRSLTAAADRLHLTQPAVSHALRRLREMFDDPLFVRGTTAMVPTETAIRLHDPVAAQPVDRHVRASSRACLRSACDVFPSHDRRQSTASAVWI